MIVDIAAAIICFAGACHNVLVGEETPRGTFQLAPYSTTMPGYGGDLLVFKQEKHAVFAVHRVFNVAGQQRLSRIHSPYARHRITITAGCVNVEPEVYDKLMDCCSTSTITIK